jgi:hypothetical protein
MDGFIWLRIDPVASSAISVKGNKFPKQLSECWIHKNNHGVEIVIINDCQRFYVLKLNFINIATDSAIFDATGVYSKITKLIFVFIAEMWIIREEVLGGGNR